jgi:hypothetical protein
MAKYIAVHPYDSTFSSLMKKVTLAVRTQNLELLEEAKKEFAEADISLFYNKETDEVRVLLKDANPVDFKLSQFEEKV